MSDNPLQWLQNHLDTEALLTRFVGFLPQLFTAIFLFLAIYVGFRVARSPIKTALNRTGLHRKLVDLLVDSVLRYAVLITALVMALDQVGVNVTTALAGVGAIGLAVGFAAQDSLSNLIAGFLIFIDKPFLTGDVITVDGQHGIVDDITLRSTRIRTYQNTYVVIPNKSILNSVLVNHSKNGDVRIETTIGIAYKEDIDKAREVILSVVEGIDRVKKDPEPQVMVTSLSASSVDLTVRTWVEDAVRGGLVRYEVLERCKKALDEADIEIPFPHLQLFVDGVQPEAVSTVRDELFPALQKAAS